jgi:hypothetical protein
MIDPVQVLGLVAGALLITALAIRELRWPKRLGRRGRGAIGILFLVVIGAATLRIFSLVLAR